MKPGLTLAALGALLCASWAASTALVTPGPEDLLGLITLAAASVAGPVLGPALILAGLTHAAASARTV